MIDLLLKCIPSFCPEGNGDHGILAIGWEILLEYWTHQLISPRLQFIQLMKSSHGNEFGYNQPTHVQTRVLRI